jgi:L-glutamine-phosphate cytidylyltransferase
VLKASPAGAARFTAAFDAARSAQGDAAAPFREGRTFEKAYLIDLLAVLLEGGEPMHQVTTHGGYMEIDTLEDASLAETWWRGG